MLIRAARSDIYILPPETLHFNCRLLVIEIANLALSSKLNKPTLIHTVDP